MILEAADTVVVPLASETDAERTAAALAEHLPEGTRVVAVHVVEKAGGAPDKASVEQREERAERIFEIVRERLADGDRDVETEIYYGTDVAETVFAAAEDVDADVVVFSPREAGRLSRLLSGDTALDLITAGDRPVLVLPGPDPDQE